jgi:hypothetical protein
MIDVYEFAETLHRSLTDAGLDHNQIHHVATHTAASLVQQEVITDNDVDAVINIIVEGE